VAAFDVAGDIAGEDLDDVEFVASGGSGTVYRAVQRSLGRVVALKVLHGVDLRDARTGREARVQAQMSWHANVVTLYGTTTLSGGSTGLVMEFAPGGSLADRIARTGPLDSESALRLGRELSSAIAAAHAAGIVHRDVKPSNVLFAADGSSRLADFGISGTATRTLDELEASVAYAAPELLEGDRPSPPNDVFALALTLLVAASGRHPFGEDAPVAALAARIQSERIRFSDHVADWPASCVDLMDRCLDLDPDERPSASEVSDGLVSCADRSGAAPTVGLPLRRSVSVRSLTLLTDRFGTEQRVLDSVSFTVPEGAITVVFGPVESGARVALEAVAGLHRITSGSVSVVGAAGESSRLSPERTVWLARSPEVFPGLTVRRNLRYMAQLTGCSSKEAGARADSAAERMLLREFLDVRSRSLSQPNRLRLHFAMALVTHPEVLLLDASGLDADVTLRDELAGLLRELAGRGVALGLYSPDVDFTCAIADRLVIMRSGRVVAEGGRGAIETAYSRSEAIVTVGRVLRSNPSDFQSAGAGGQERCLRIPVVNGASISGVLGGLPEELQDSASAVDIRGVGLRQILLDLTTDDQLIDDGGLQVVR
jgi:ABC-type multidrug transport system ATPase subunit